MTGWKHFLLILCSVAILVAIPYLFKVDQTSHPNIQKETNEHKPNHIDFLWGVDSVSLTTDGLYQCVTEYYDTPMIWGRYLGDRQNMSTGLTIQEVDFLHTHNIKLLLMYNHFSEAVGYENGKHSAEHAISLAQALHVPKGKAIFANIEPSDPVDSDFLEGWFERLQLSDYTPAIYGSFLPGHELDKMYKRLANTNESFHDKMILWTAYPQTGTTTKNEAPFYNPTGPVGANVIGWQYGGNATRCAINTNLFTKEVTDYVW